MPVALVGIALVLAGALVPSRTLIDLARGPVASPELAVQLLAGAAILRGCTALLGVFLVSGGLLGWWRGGATPAAAVPARSAPCGTELAIACGLLAAGAALRLYGLNQGLWVDEVYALLEYVRPPLGEILTSYRTQNQHFLFSIPAHLSVLAFGESAWSLRLPAALSRCGNRADGGTFV